MDFRKELQMITRNTQAVYLCLVVCVTVQRSVVGQVSLPEASPVIPMSLPDLALDRLQSQHHEKNPLLVSQDELDQLIQQGGGGACPIAAV